MTSGVYFKHSLFSPTYLRKFKSLKNEKPDQQADFTMFLLIGSPVLLCGWMPCLVTEHFTCKNQNGGLPQRCVWNYMSWNHLRSYFYADFCFINHVIIPTLSFSLWGAFNVLLFNIFVFLLLTSHAKASFSDPGVVPLPTTSLDFSDLHQAKKHKIMRVKMCGQYVSDVKHTRPPRAHHCRTCQRCIKRMDHHCPWINNCVGECNQKFFVLFLFYTALASVHAIILVGISWSMDCIDCSQVYSQNTRVVHTVALMVESCLFGLFVLAIMCDQISAILQDTTAVEHIQKNIRVRRKPKLAILAEVFGRGSYFWWFVPCSSPTVYTSSVLPNYDV